MEEKGRFWQTEGIINQKFESEYKETKCLKGGLECSFIDMYKIYGHCICNRDF